MIREKFKCTVDTAFDGLEAFNMFSARIDSAKSSTCLNSDCPARYYRLIFMDLNMPVMDGFEATTKILAL